MYYRSDLPHGLTCFHELVSDEKPNLSKTIPTLIRFAEEGSIHLDLYEADTARLAAYRYYRFYSAMSIPTTAIVLHAKTKGEADGSSSAIENMDEVDAFFKKKVAVGFPRGSEN